MELSQLVRKVLNIFSANSTEELISQVKSAVLSNDFTKHKSFVECIGGDLSTDYLQKIFQYYEADRKEKMQDYTPKSLAETIAKLSTAKNEMVCYDMCSGSGALTIQKWCINKEIAFICEEFDVKVIPLLLFNLSVRNIRATVIHGDILSGERFNSWQVVPGLEFSSVTECEIPLEIKADVCISNPPYNMKWEPSVLAKGEERFARWGIAPKSNANYAFITTALTVADRVAMIMPNGTLSTDNKEEKQIRKFIIEDNLVESVCICPNKMFEATSIPVCLMTFDKKKNHQDIIFIDMRQLFTEEQREQCGQSGGASHENRIYTKTVNTFSSEQQQQLLDAIARKENITEFSKSVHISCLDDFSLVPSRYIDFNTRETAHRPYKDIVNDLNHIIRLRNMCKLVVNETLARQLGLLEVFEVEKSEENDKATAELVEQIAGERLLKSDYFKLTKNKNEFAFVNNDKEELSVVFLSLLQAWKQQVMFLNQEENRKLIELRDALLPDLMEGKVLV